MGNRLIGRDEPRQVTPYSAPPPGTPGMGGFTYGPEPFEGAPDNPGDVYGATRLRWDPRSESWVPMGPRRRRKRAMSAQDKVDFVFLKSQGVSAEKAAGLILAGVGRGR